jgi:hypothetical protein
LQIVSQTFDRGYALLIGIGQCQESQFSLPVTVKDMQALRQVLVNPNFCAYPDDDRHLRWLHDVGATRQAILDGLTWLQERATEDPNATVIVYYSGHGWLDKSDDRYYLIPHDFDPYDWKGTALSAEDFNRSLHQILAQRLLVILDCCHAAGMATAKDGEAEPRLPKGVVSSPAPKGIVDDLKQGEGRVVLTSCRDEQKSWILPDNSMSVYTCHLLEAITGAGHKPGDTEVTVFQLADYVGKAVPESAKAMGKAQTPRFEGDTERFAIALLQGGKGLPIEGWEALPPELKGHPQVQVQASGELSVAMVGPVTNSPIVTGDGNVVGTGNVVQRGKDNIHNQKSEELKENQQLPPVGKGFEPTPGLGQPLRSKRYICPHCDRSGQRFDVADPVPTCPVHNVPMKPEGT